MLQLTLRSPLDGWSTPLEEVPDEVFATRMLGDGVAIDPTGSTLYAPCDGELIVVPASKHAVTIRAENGAEILLHVGIDTVNLRGEGFELHVSQGDRVKAGDRLISFDLDLIARSAKSAITPMIIANGERFRISRKQQDCAIKVGDAVLELVAIAEEASAVQVSTEKASRSFIVGLEHGIHARPAAQFASSAKRFASNITVQAHGRKANGKSAVSLMSLRVRFGDEALVEAVGPDAAQAVAVLEALVVAKGKSALPEVVAVHGGSKGVCASAGMAIGWAFQLKRIEIQVDEAGRGISQENAHFDRAHATLKTELQRRVETSQGPQRSVAEAHLEFLEDPELLSATQQSIAQGMSAGFAWRQAIHGYVSLLGEADDPRIRERVDDLLDLESQLLLAITGQSASQAISLPDQAIVLAQDLLPSQISHLDPTKLAGICLAGGGPTSHVAILAAAMGVPAIVAAGPGVLSIASGSRLIIDADQAKLIVDPQPSELEAAEKILSARRTRRAADQATAQRECRTADGQRIEIFANVGAIAEARVAVAEGAEGCGLLRTEFLFLDRQTAPDEAEQAAQYQAIASAFAPRPVIIRTLDIGGDKPIPYLPLPHEENPALGLRGVRTSLWRMDLLRTQLRAVLSVKPVEQCKLLLPMITSPAEVRAIRTVLSEVGGSSAMQVGVMIETPASAVIADQLIREADFLSIGTNDLTQYTLAMDRGHPELAAQLDALHPAVLRLIATAAKAGRAHNKLVAVCGGLASDPIAAPVLIGLGVTELSTIPSVIPRLKALISALTLDECREIASRALEQTSAEAVRALLNEHAADKAGAPA